MKGEVYSGADNAKIAVTTNISRIKGFFLERELSWDGLISILQTHFPGDLAV